jgi:hypothetical protein
MQVQTRNLWLKAGASALAKFLPSGELGFHRSGSPLLTKGVL